MLANHPWTKFEPKVAVPVPAEIYAWKASLATRQHALDVQTRNREQLTQAFANGLAVLGYERAAKGDGCFLLGAWDEGWGY